MTAHTPGPKLYSLFCRDCQRATAFTECQTCCNSCLVCGQCQRHTNLSPPMNRLHAAAPNMLALLRGIVLDGQSKDETVEMRRRAAIRVIAMATGEEMD
jgi:hypothetical protein